MLNKARKNFIILSMAALIVIVSVLVAVINIVNYNHVSGKLDDALNEIAVSLDMDKKKKDDEPETDEIYSDDKETITGEADSGGEEVITGEADSDGEEVITGEADSGDKKVVTGEADSGDKEITTEKADSDDKEKLTGDKPEKTGHGRTSAITQYGSRYFIIVVDDDGTTEGVIQNEDIITDEEAESLLSKTGGAKNGLVDDYKFEKLNENATVFLDCSVEYSYVRSLLIISMIVGIGGIALALLLIIFISKKIVEPVRINIEKQKQFITNAGHELKTPIAVASMNLDVLSMDIEDNEWIEGTQKQLGKLKKLVENLIALSKVDENDEMPEMMSFSISEEARECAETFKGAAQIQGKALECNIEDGLMIQGNPGLTRQLITILIDNAVKYSCGDEPVGISLYKEGNNAVFETVNNWDKSIENDQLDQMFERFYRGDSSKSSDTKPSGYGLGLSIAKAISDKNRYSLTVKTDSEGRIVFRVSAHISGN